MRSSGPGRRARLQGGRDVFAFWPIASAFAVIGGGKDRLSGSHLFEQAKCRLEEEPLLSVVPRRPASEPRERG